MAVFDKKQWNDAVFQKYLKKVPNLKENSLVKNGVLEVNQSLAARLTDGVGGNLLIEPIKGLLDGDYVNYDGNTNITTSSRGTFQQAKIVVGRAKGWKEKDFSTELTGVNFMEGIANEVAEYWQGVDMETILAILEGVFGMADTQGAAFVEAHTLDVSAEEDGTMGATTINKALQKAFGDKKKFVSMAFMHSAVATDLENLQLLEYKKYTDSNGITSNIEIAQIGNKTVIIDDDMPIEEVEAEYELTSDVAIDNSKTYYTRSGSAGSYVYTEVETPDVDDIATYYEMTAEAYSSYTTYLLGKGAIEYCNVGVKVPSEVSRDAATNGGEDMLYTRQRKLYAPKYISWKGSRSIISPTKEQLATGSNWEIVNDANPTTSARVYVNHKLIPFGRIISRVK